MTKTNPSPEQGFSQTAESGSGPDKRRSFCWEPLLKLFVLSVLAVTVFSSCEQERDPCLQPTTVYLRLRTLQPETDTTFRDTLLPGPRWTAIDPGVTLVFGDATASFNLPLNSLTDSSVYALQPDTSLMSFDTVTFHYGRRLQFLSNACGYTYFYTLQRVSTTRHNVDSVRVQNNDVNSNVNTPEHVQVYF